MNLSCGQAKSWAGEEEGHVLELGPENQQCDGFRRTTAFDSAEHAPMLVYLRICG